VAAYGSIGNGVGYIFGAFWGADLAGLTLSVRARAHVAWRARLAMA
jgi:hypothetical protein